MLFLFVTLRACVSLCAEGWTCLLSSGPQCSMPRLADCLLGRWALLGVVVVWGLPGFTRAVGSSPIRLSPYSLSLQNVLESRNQPSIKP